MEGSNSRRQDSPKKWSLASNNTESNIFTFVFGASTEGRYHEEPFEYLAREGKQL